MSEEAKILEKCERLFMRYGIKSVTMDDVSRELGMSKKDLVSVF
ncbi:MAG: TetR family transcriptional regulator [Bacteroidetes bacterium]|nr:TetR family transcriptional regulator [Bacteroidota bacterium]